MKLVVLSRSRRIPSTKRIVETALARGHVVRILNPLHVELFLETDQAQLFYRRKRLRVPDVVIPRVACSITGYGLPIVDQFSVLGAAVMNSARSIGLSRNPFRCLQQLAASGLAVPATVMAHDATELKAMVDLVGGVPVLVKLLQGGERRGIMVCESLQTLKAALEALLGLGHNLVLQEYVHKRSRDLRVFVVGGKALATVSRRAKPGRLSRTLSRIARLERVDLTPAARDAAEKAAATTGLEVCAVDLLEVRKGPPRVFEVNASPSLSEMEAATGVDLATAIIEHAEALAARRPSVASKA
jgi:ribosomal protein S6--L-glutamate ligase